MSRALPWIFVLAVLAALALGARAVRGAASAGDAAARADATIAVDLPAPYAPPGCGRVPAVGGRA